MYIEIAPFRLNEGVDEKALLEASDAFQVAFVSKQQGIGRRVLMRAAGGEYADLVFFEDKEAADRVLAAEATSAECATFFSIMQPPDASLPDMGVLSFDHVRTYEAAPTPASSVLECVLFGPAAGVGRDAFVAAAVGIDDWARAQPGFVSRELFEVGDGRWVDVVRWATMEDALAAADAANQSPSCAAFFGLIDMDNVQMLHGTPALPALRA